MTRIAFHSPQLDIRGSCVALYDYALYNETLLHNQSFIVVKKSEGTQLVALKKFANRFPVFIYETKTELYKILKKEKTDVLYCIKYGKKDDIVFTDIKTVVHCVFDVSEPHGDVYAAVSETLAKKYNYPLFVPHMVGLQPSTTGENMREELGIPISAVVFGRHGGLDTFDLQFVNQSICNIVNDREDIYFVFMNTPEFYRHPQIKYLKPTCDVNEKNRFICTCDAMIHAQSLGETFGLSIAEFSVNNKPIITYGGIVWNDNYKNILGTMAIYYKTEEELYGIFNRFNPADYKGKDLNCYKEYSPKKVMEIFKKIFL